MLSDLLFIAVFRRLIELGSAQLLREEGGCYSPLSLYYALALTAQGAEGQTAEELCALLGADKKELAKQCGFFLERGVYLNPIPDRSWDFTPAVKVGDRVTAGDTIGTVPEGVFTHQIMVPFITKGEWTVKSIKEKGNYNVRDTV